ncbi:MAG: TatD family hydrolase [Planctomycetota bacterium]
MDLDLIDIGANLAANAFDSDRDAVIDRAREAGVRRMVVTGPTASESVQALALVRERPGVLWSTAGVHPHYAADYNEATTAELRQLAEAPEVVAVGECGLDFYRDLSPRDAQVAALEAQLQLAADLVMPVFLHERDAHEAMAAVLREWRPRIPRGVVHCFTGDERALRAYLDLDYHIGITGWLCDERRGQHLRDLVRLVPAGRLMIETDAPYLLPRTIRPRPKSRRNEPANLPWVLDAVASCLGKPAAQVAEETTRTAVAFFGLA